MKPKSGPANFRLGYSKIKSHLRPWKKAVGKGFLEQKIRIYKYCAILPLKQRKP